MASFSSFVMQALKFVHNHAFQLVICTVLLIGFKASYAENIVDIYSQKLKGIENIQPLGPDLFGDQIDTNTGGVEFKAIDLSVPTNSGIPVAVGRVLNVRDRRVNWKTNDSYNGILYGHETIKEPFGAFWDLDIPFIKGYFDARKGWLATDNSASRCSNGLIPSHSQGLWPLYATPFPAKYYWNGNQINIPGVGSESMLLTQPATPITSNGGPYVATTKSNWLVGCIQTIKNGDGQGFYVLTPDGKKYIFDWIASRAVPSIMSGAIIDQQSTPAYTNGYTNMNRITEYSSPVVALPLVESYLYVSRVEDRFGNWVSYTYDNTNPFQLKSISSNDGASISLSYNAAGQLISATDGTRNVSYEYGYVSSNGGGPRYDLIKVILPDSTYWSYGGASGLMQTNGTEDYGSMNLWKECKLTVGDMMTSMPPGVGDASSFFIKHPSGAEGRFSFRKIVHGYNYVPEECTKITETSGVTGTNYHYIMSDIPPAFQASTLYQKSILTTDSSASQIWKLEFFPTWSFASQCTASAPCASTSETRITNPDASVDTYVYGNNYITNFGFLLSKARKVGNSPVKTETNTYVSNQAQFGFEKSWGLNLDASANPLVTDNRPLLLSITFQDGVSYQNQYNQFDVFARATDVTRSNSNGFSKTERVAYSDNTNKWVLGQLASQTDVATGLVEQSNTYDPVTANLLTKSAFGVLQESYTYNADGTLATVKDGKNNAYALTNWKRGIPQLITAPNSSTQSGVVNDSGWLTSVTNQRGYVTGYAYDAMGRLASITPPTGDTVAWAGTTLTFTPLTVATYGVPVGGWKHTISRGNYRKETYMDALYRPLVIREYDNANVTGTERFTVKAYDTLNREVFSSYPGKTAGLTVGVRTEYDALGRVIATKADSELGVLTTTTEYLVGGGIKVTGPDGTVTTRTFRSLDAPSYEQMVQEVGPGGVTTSISRDVFGKPLTLTRSGTDGLSISKQFAYDTNQRLCMRTEPETGTSIIDYDAAGNVLWAANGQTVANATVCNRAAAVAGAKINYTYDALNRVTSTNVPNSTDDPTVTYLSDGTVNTLSNGTATWTYTYNKLGKPVTESLKLGTDPAKTVTHAYDTLANESSLTYPNGTVVTYAPNALGQATQAGTYATGLSYRASGFLSAMTYGNGATYSAQPNLRGLPARRLDKKGTTVITDELMAYDQDANPVCVRDSSTGNPGHRDFTYDARDRLIKVSAPNQSWWISSEYQYDSQDNIKMARLGTRQYNYSYNANNRLLDIGQPATAPVATNFGLLNCDDYALLVDIDSTIIGGGGTGGGGGGGGDPIDPPPECPPNNPDCNAQPFSVMPMLLAGDTLKYSFSHDAQGRMTAKGTQAYVFDALNRMTGVTGKETYLYDGNGRRVQVTKTSDSKKNYSLYGLDGKLLVEDNRQTLKRTEYIYAGGRLIAKRIQPITSTGANNGTATVTTIHTDFLGSPVAETNSAGTVTRVERYTPYGEPADMALDAGLGFTGHATDVATGLTYMQQRYYDAEIGRFISPDPVGPEEDFINHFNRYNYVQNNPVRYTDPDGSIPLAIPVILWAVDKGVAAYDAYQDSQDILSGEATVAEVGARRGLEHAAGATLGLAGRFGAKHLGGAGKLADLPIHLRGVAGENFLRNSYGGGKRSVNIPGIGVRHIDNFVKGVAQESKMGRVSLTSFVKEQIKKDAALLRDASSGVRKVEWHFFPGDTGFGPTDNLRRALEDAGIKIIEQKKL